MVIFDKIRPRCHTGHVRLSYIARKAESTVHATRFRLSSVTRTAVVIAGNVFCGGDWYIFIYYVALTFTFWCIWYLEEILRPRRGIERAMYFAIVAFFEVQCQRRLFYFVRRSYSWCVLSTLPPREYTRSHENCHASRPKNNDIPNCACCFKQLNRCREFYR